jgi:hypothetical protein
MLLLIIIIIIIIIGIGASSVKVKWFVIVNWRSQEIQKIDRKTKKILTVVKMHHPKTDTQRLYVKRT